MLNKARLERVEAEAATKGGPYEEGSTRPIGRQLLVDKEDLFLVQGMRLRSDEVVGLATGIDRQLPAITWPIYQLAGVARAVGTSIEIPREA